MTYLKEIDELHEKRWQEARERAQQFFDTYFTSTEVSPVPNSSSNPYFNQPLPEPILPTPKQETVQQEKPRPNQKSKKGFTPAEHEEFISRMKASGHTVMMADGRIDPSSTRTKQTHGSFRRSTEPR